MCKFAGMLCVVMGCAFERRNAFEFVRVYV